MMVCKCKMCGGRLNIDDFMSVIECDYCGSQQTISCSHDEEIQNLSNGTIVSTGSVKQPYVYLNKWHLFDDVDAYRKQQKLKRQTVSENIEIIEKDHIMKAQAAMRAREAKLKLEEER